MSLLKNNVTLIKTKMDSFPGYKPTKREQKLLDKYKKKSNSLKIKK